MEIKIDNLRAEKAKDGRVYVTFSDQRISEYQVLLGVLEMREKVTWTTEDGDVERVAIY